MKWVHEMRLQEPREVRRLMGEVDPIFQTKMGLRQGVVCWGKSIIVVVVVPSYGGSRREHPGGGGD